MALKALIFDMDGTLIDSDPLHMAVFVDFLGARGITLAEGEYVTRIHGRRNEEIFAELLPDEDPFAMHVAKEAAFRERLGTQADPIAGAHALLDRAERLGLATAVVTNGCRENLQAMLAATGLAGRFAHAASADDVARPKPDPMIYLEALDALGVAAHEALAFEDSPTGIAAATAARIPTIGMMSSLSAAELTGLGAIRAIRDFTDPALEAHLTCPEGATE